MEDSAQDLFSDENNKNLKKISRTGLEYLFEKNVLNEIKTFVRINAQNSEFYYEDIRTISKISQKKQSIEGIFLPKVENYTQILDCHENLLKLGTNKIKIVPMIESEIGLQNLNQILSEDKHKNIIDYVHYGHYDFCLNNNFWPFPEPYHFEYWEIIKKISKTIIKFKKKYIHTPFPLIETKNIFWNSVKYMQENIFNDELNLSLVNIDLNYINKPSKIKKTKLKNISKNPQYKKIFAHKIIKEYLNNKSRNKSFSLSRKRFIPPHLYLAANKFLNHKN